MDEDHWRRRSRSPPSWKRSSTPPTPPDKKQRNEGPRLNMNDYVYPEDLSLGDNQRLKGLNSALRWKFRQIGVVYDNLSAAKEERDHIGQHKGHHVWRRNNDTVIREQQTLNSVLSEAKAWIAEVKSIGGAVFVPPMLEGIVLVEDFVPAGSMKYLVNKEYFFEENLENVPGVEKDWRSNLESICFVTNRLIFQQECGRTGRFFYRGLKDELRRQASYSLGKFRLEDFQELFKKVCELVGPKDKWGSRTY